jgi:hypothetical protein
MSVTGNPARDLMLRQAIEAYGTDLDALKAALPGDFGTDQDEVDAMVAAISVVEGQHVETVETVEMLTPSKSLENIEPPHANGAARPHHEARPDAPQPETEPSLTLVEAQAALAVWQTKAQAARIELRNRDMAQRTARGKLADAINYFLRGNVTMTREQLQREHIASEQQRKAEGGGRRRHAPSHGPSAYDIGRAGHGNSVNQRYGAVRRALLPGQRAYSLEGAMARSGSAKVDTHGTAAIPAVKSE